MFKELCNAMSISHLIMIVIWVGMMPLESCTSGDCCGQQLRCRCRTTECSPYQWSRYELQWNNKRRTSSLGFNSTAWYFTEREIKPPAVLALRGGNELPSVIPGNVPYMVDLEEIPPLDAYRDSLDPAKYPPLDPVYDEDGDMVVPQPMSLEKLGTVHRLLDESGRLLTSREAAKRGLGRFIKKPKGRNSLTGRCTCGNKIPCDGNVMITKDEQGKLHYHKIPRYDVGAAHAWECRQPAQYMTTPTNINMTEVFGGLSPVLLHKLSMLTGMTPEEAYAIGDQRMQNETVNQPCSFCDSSRHQFFNCPLIQDDSDDTVDLIQQERASLESLLLDTSLNESAREELKHKIRDCNARIDASKFYAHVSITKENKTWEYNAPGVNWANGECSIRDVIRVTEKLEPAPTGPEIVVPLHYDDVMDAVKQARSGQTIRVLAGEHRWGGTSHVPAYNNEECHLIITCDGGIGSLPDHGCLHTISSSGGGEGEPDIFTRSLRMQSYTLLYGLWLLKPSSSGRFVGVSCYSMDGGMPGHHIVRHLHKHEEEPFEIGRRSRPYTFTTVCITLLDASWSFERCDVFCLDGIAVSLVESAELQMDGCKVGASGILHVHSDGTVEAEQVEGLAYIAIDVEDWSNITMRSCSIQLTQVCGLRLQLDSKASFTSCIFALNGGLGGCAVSLADHAQAELKECFIFCGSSASPIWRETAAIEATVTSASRGSIKMSRCNVTGQLWLSVRRPRHVCVEETEIRPGPENVLTKYSSGREQAQESGMKNPVKIWGDSRYEAWWPLHRLEEIGFKMVSIETDGTGQRRHVSDADISPALDEADDEAMRVWVNRSKQIELKEWGWEGTLDDVYDTDAPVLDADGKWPLREVDVHEQIRERVQIQFKRRRQEQVQYRRESVMHALQLQSGSAIQKISSANSLARSVDRGDLASLYWLDRAIGSESDRQVLKALQEAVIRLEPAAGELESVQDQLGTVEVDDVGDFGEQEIVVGGAPILLSQVSNSVLSAIWPHWPLYPQDKFAPAGSIKAEQGQSDIQQQMERKRKPWESKEAVATLKLDNSSMIAGLTFEQRWELADAGFIPFPEQHEMLQETRDRDVDGWFRIIMDKDQEKVWIPVLRNYASSMKIELPESVTAAHNRRKRLESELSLTKDYLEALGISGSLHLSDSDWRTLYPHLDTKRLINPPTLEKLERVQRRVLRLEDKLSEALDIERVGLMDVVYPFAKRVERAFKMDDQKEIAALTKLRGSYSLFAKFVDNNLQPPISLSEDGTQVTFDERLLFEPPK